MTTENLRADLDALPGVASAEVVLNDDEVPLARVWLDGTLSGDDVRHLVDGLVADSIPSVVLQQQKKQRRRIGLGRGLDDLLPTEETARIPMQLHASTGHRQSIVGVAVIESTSGVIVEIESDQRGVHSELVTEDGGVDRAAIRGITAIAGIGEDVGIDITDAESDDGLIVLVTAVSGSKRAVGAAFVEYGRPYAIARAGLDALNELDGI